MIRINMIPHERKKTSIVALELVVAGSLFLIILIGIGIWWHFLDSTIAEKQASIRNKEETVQKLQIIIDQVLKYEKDRDLLQAKLNTIDELKKNQKGPVRLLDELNRRIPKEIWLNQMRTAGNLVTIRGFGLSQTSIGDFMGSLETSPFFKQVKLKISSLRMIENREVYEFELDFQTNI